MGSRIWLVYPLKSYALLLRKGENDKHLSTLSSELGLIGWYLTNYEKLYHKMLDIWPRLRAKTTLFWEGSILWLF